MTQGLDGNAIIYCEGAFNTPNGKTAHGLIRFTKRYRIISLVDSSHVGQDSGEILDGKKNGIPIVDSLESALSYAASKEYTIQYFVIGIAPDGGRIEDHVRKNILKALHKGLNIDSGLHDFLCNDPDISRYAATHSLSLRDIRKTPSRETLHFFSGKIESVTCLKIAILGTDSAIGKRTTAWLLVQGLQDIGYRTEMIGTGQTAWMQGAKYSLILDSLINDFVSGEIEHTIYEAWKNENPDIIVIEGQGSLMNPAYPGGFEILAAGRPDIVILQHAPKRLEYDGFPGYRLHPLSEQINAIELLSGKKVIAVTINHENMEKEDISNMCTLLTKETGLPAFDILAHGPQKLSALIQTYLNNG